MAKAIFCIAKDYAQAEAIVTALRNAGFTNDDISVLLPDKRGTKDFAHVQGTKAPEGATTGAASGGLLGGVLGWLVGIGSLAIPGLGPFIAAGPIMAALSGAAVGATVGGVTGALIGMGIPEYEAKRYEGKLKGGNVLISVHIDNHDEQKRAKEILGQVGAEDVTVSGEARVPSAQSVDRERAEREQAAGGRVDVVRDDASRRTSTGTSGTSGAAERASEC